MVNTRWDALRSWLWPGRCLLCRARVNAGTGLCAGCRTDLPWLTGSCQRCAAPLPRAISPAICGACQQKPPVFDHAYAALRYAAPVDRLILNLKYHQRIELARPLGKLLIECLPTESAKPQIIVPVPLHRSRLRQRGYNQSLEIARVVGRELVIPLATNLAERVRATATQTELPLAQRARNVRNAFAAEAELNGEHVAIVDDVMTSGQTVNAVAKVLRKAGAGRISVWVVARA